MTLYVYKPRKNRPCKSCLQRSIEEKKRQAHERGEDFLLLTKEEHKLIHSRRP